MSIPVLRVLLVNLADGSNAVGISSVLEKVIPDLDENKPWYQTAGEAFLQLGASTLISMEMRNLMSGIYLNDPTGGMSYSPILYLLQPKLIKKLKYLGDLAAQKVGDSMFSQV